MKVRGEWTEQNNGINSHCKYANRGFKRHLPCDVAVAFGVAAVLFFVLLLRLFFETRCQMKLKLKVN